MAPRLLVYPAQQRLAEPLYTPKSLKVNATTGADVPLVSRKGGNGGGGSGNAGVNGAGNGGGGGLELIDAAELAARLRVPPSWVRNRTRARTPKQERIPCVRLGRYVRFEWGSEQLMSWLAKHRN